MELHYEYHLSYLRDISIQTPVFANHYLGEQIGFYPKPLYNMAPAAYGYNNETDKMLRFLLKEMTTSVELGSEYRKYKSNIDDVKLVHYIIFSGTLPYKYYRNTTHPTDVTSTLQGALSDIVMSILGLLDSVAEINCSENIEKCWELQKTAHFLNPYKNYGMLTTNITSALHNMNVFLLKNYDQMENMAMFICLFISIVYAIILIGILVYQLEHFERCKKTVYKYLKLVP